VLEGRVLRRIFGPKWRKEYGDEKTSKMRTFIFFTPISRIIRYIRKRMTWMGSAARTEVKGTA
jgi:hypothetical protein